ncbi:hypothetical protein CH282_22195 [Rhodococcus sp. 06-418-1B]|nr:hypothetical protein CH282_22195 [Rhodococcus sp. 06-418-1B]
MRSARGLLVHEWIEPSGGAEKVLEALASNFPDADIACLWNDDRNFLQGREITQSVLSRTPLRKRKPLALPLMPLVWRRPQIKEYDWAIVSTHLFAHHVRLSSAARNNVLKLLYVHTPARYLWTPELDSRGASLYARAAAIPLKRLDRVRALDADDIAANSHFVAARITSSWERDSKVIYPPVGSEFISSGRWAPELTQQDESKLSALPSEYLLGASRLVPYKDLDKVVRVAAYKKLPVVLAGNGPDRARLSALAAQLGVRCIFLGRVSNALLYSLYSRAIAYIFPPIEDFGIMPVEAMAAGGRVVVNQIGGSAESVLHGVTGAHCDPQDVRSIASAIDIAGSCSQHEIKARARLFDVGRFNKEIVNWLDSQSAK